MKNFIIGIVLTLGILGLVFFNYSTSGEKRVYIKKQYVKDDLDIKVVIFKNKKELRKSYKEKFPDEKNTSDILGYSIWFRPHDGTCTIYVPEPKEDDDLETWGHELAHCVYGSWHK